MLGVERSYPGALNFLCPDISSLHLNAAMNVYGLRRRDQSNALVLKIFIKATDFPVPRNKTDFARPILVLPSLPLPKMQLYGYYKIIFT